MTFSILQAIKSLAVNALLLPERWSTGVSYNPFSDKVTQDPYPVYAELRERSPAHHSRLMDAIVLSRYADVDRILTSLPVGV